MKKLLIGFLLLNTSLFSFAQHKKILKFSLIGQQTHMDNKDDRNVGNFFNYQASYCTALSLNFNYYLSPSIFIGIGATGAEHQQRFISNNIYENISTLGNKRNMYLKVPLYLGLESRKLGNFVSIFQQVGIQNSFLLKADGAALYYYDHGPSDYYFNNIRAQNNYFKKYSFGVVSETGLQFHLNSKTLLSCSFIFDYFFNDAENKSAQLTDGKFLYQSDKPNRAKTHLRSEAISMGIGFKL